MQWIYEYVHIPAGMTIDDLAADRDSISTSLTDEIVACNDPSRNARQALVTRWPKPKETMDAPAGAPLAGAATRSVAAQRDMARGRDEQARQVAHAEFDESISDSFTLIHTHSHSGSHSHGRLHKRNSTNQSRTTRKRATLQTHSLASSTRTRNSMASSQEHSHRRRLVVRA